MAKTRRNRFVPVVLPPDFWPRLVRLAEQAGLSPRGGAPLATAVRVASQLYTGQRNAIASQATDGDILAARLLFYLVRDFEKVVAPLSELWRGGWRPTQPTLRVLDLGAGVGASSLGVARFAAQVGLGGVQVTALDTAAPALDVAGRVLPALCDGDWAARVEVDTRVGSAEQPRGLGQYDVVIGSFVLNEMLLAHPVEDRAQAGAAIVQRWAERVAPGGALVVLEPALKDESRTLSAVRDALLADGGVGELTLIAPCLHEAPCPMLAGERDWCHQELPLGLPAPFDGIARGAGLRWEGLSFSYLSWVRGGVGAATATATDSRTLRVVSDGLVSKGKRELLGCGDGELVRLTRLDRSESEANEAFGGLKRGDVFEVQGAVEKGRGLRVEPNTQVTRRGPKPS